MIREVRFAITEGPGFLTQMGMEREEDGTIALVVYNRRGDVYAFSRLSEHDFRTACALLSGDDDAADKVRRGCD